MQYYQYLCNIKNIFIKLAMYMETYQMCATLINS